MTASGRTTNRFVSMAIYTGFGILVIWSGTALINHSVDSKFYRYFLLKWHVGLMACNGEFESWSYFSGANDVQYMEEVTLLMRRKGFPPPDSNTGRPYVYRVKRIGVDREDIFILCLPKKLVLYGISTRTFKRLDTYIDGRPSAETGTFIGRKGKDERNYTGQWTL